ncbi:MAG: NADH-quinone oxidoreductase subunit M [Chloroflexota bacterium]|nr:MAG: NADH-quinone oxidoreductase subunit M [Chloroflexota bacterium]
MITTLIALPVIGALAILVFRSSASATRWLSLAFALAEAALAALLVLGFDPGSSGVQFAEAVAWVPALGIQYAVGVDGISLWMIALTAFLAPIAIGASWPLMEEHARDFGALLLLLTSGLIGAFAATDMVLFFVFWEVMLIPMYLLIGMRGGDRRIGAAIKFFIYTAVGSLLMLAGIIALHVHASSKGINSFAIADLVRAAQGGVPFWIFLVFVLAFAIKVPLFPLHTWLPDAYTQAPLPTLVLGTMLVKVGAYGFIRFIYPLFPNELALNANWLTILAVIGIIYGALCAIAQRDLVRLLAYSSISHLGFVLLGILALNSQGVMGGLIQMVNHSISAGALFIVAAMIARRVGSTDIVNLGGLAARYPLIAAFFLLSMFSSAGVPGLNGFVGEFLTMLGAFQPRQRLVVVAAGGVVLGAIYLVWMFQRLMHGRQKTQTVIDGRDLTMREALVLIPLAVAMVWIGVRPNTLLGRMESSVAVTVEQARTAAAPILAASSNPTGRP